MPRDPRPVEPAPPEAAAELSAALTAMDFGLGTLFQPGNRMADPDVLAAAASITGSPRPTGAQRAPETAPQAEPVDEFPSAMRRHLDDLNRQLIRVAHGLASIDSTLASAINDHLDAIGLDDIKPNRTAATNT